MRVEASYDAGLGRRSRGGAENRSGSSAERRARARQSGRRGTTAQRGQRGGQRKVAASAQRREGHHWPRG